MIMSSQRLRILSAPLRVWWVVRNLERFIFLINLWAQLGDTLQPVRDSVLLYSTPVNPTSRTRAIDGELLYTSLRA